ncbi:MAG: hypothetical protein J7480_09445 [Microbacteriaceae bacterium]|nr:hypothetical protein [Microbacteriaceae bacterium]
MKNVLTKSLRWGGVFAAVLLIGAGVVGWLVSGERGLVSGLVGTALAVVFMALTAVSILVVDRRSGGRPNLVAFAATVVGVFLVKAVLFVLLMIWLTSQAWLDPAVFGFTALVAVLGTLAIDIAAMVTTRVPIVELPSSGDPNP